MSTLNIDPEIREAIVLAKAKDPRTIAAELSARFGRVIPTTLVVQVRGSLKRAENVERARERASSTLDENMDITGDVKHQLYDLFNDETIPLKMRLEASKELRMWVKSETDTAGIMDSGSNTLFVISDEWRMDDE